jgi:membrane protein required for colicin V production
MNFSAVNSFDALIYFFLVVAVAMGLRSGLLRSLATIFGYLAAMPIAVAGAPMFSAVLADQVKLPLMQGLSAFFIVFLIVGMALGAVFRIAVGEMVGPTISIPDRIAGALLGAVRVALLAVVLVLVFDRIIPSHLQPPFLTGSRLKPTLSEAGQKGLKSLPPEITGYIDRLKRERGL